MTDHGRVLLARLAVSCARSIADAEGVILHLELDQAEVDWWSQQIEYQRAAVADVEERLPSADLLRAYQRTDGEPGNPEADALLAEIERRGLDV